MSLHHSISSNTNSSNPNSRSYRSKASKFWRSLKGERFLQVCSSLYRVFANTVGINDESQLVCKCDRQRNLYLEVYDPTTEIYWHFHSKQDALVWLKQRYYTQDDCNYQAKIEVVHRNQYDDSQLLACPTQHKLIISSNLKLLTR